MQDKHLYEYAVIRVVPKIEREEFVNVGIVLFSKKENFLEVRYHLHSEKIQLLSPDTDLEQIEENLLSFEKIAKGGADGGRIAEMDTASRFRWLTAVRSSCIQTTRPHSGLSPDLNTTLDKLYQDLVS